ncbi:MAG: enoyl-CoA hydratase [Rhizobiales bacterium]|nr:enoyl-CoA hydratase [Hyphomicrobiales bacterium]
MTTLANDLVWRSDAGPIATLTLNRPDKGNALSEAMLAALSERIIEVDRDDGVRVVVLAANGKIFCGGHDLAEMRAHEDQGYFEDLFARCTRMMLSIRQSRKPFIARVQGAAVAAGCQLVATCDLAYAADTARFGVNGINLGLFCSTPSVAVSRSILPKQALDLLLTGRLVDAKRAAELGLINAAVPAADLDATVAESARLVAEKLPEAIALGKNAFYAQGELDIADAYALAGRCMAENMGFRETKDLIDGFVAARRK